MNKAEEILKDVQFVIDNLMHKERKDDNFTSLHRVRNFLKEFAEAKPTNTEAVEEQKKRDWPEDYSHENGNYMNFCKKCDKEFFGHKRRTRCKLCSAEAVDKGPSGKEMQEKYNELFGGLRPQRHTVMEFAGWVRDFTKDSETKEE